MTVRWYRKRSSAQREAKLGSAFLSVRGIVKEGEESYSEKSPPSTATTASSGLSVKTDIFSRQQLTPLIVLPDKAILRPNATRDEIIGHYTAEGTLPLPFAPFMGASPISPISPEGKRKSTASWISFNRDSFLSPNSPRRSRFSISSMGSNASSIATGSQRKVRQLFNPVLPDELVISLGQQLNIVNSFDDGWCIVGRNGFSGEVELGAVPAWCFIKPSPGLRAERPMRISSLGVTISIEASPDIRDNIMSWSNF